MFIKIKLQNEVENVYLSKISVANLIIVNFRKHLPDGKI
jgi:hypothetical protein